MDYATFESVSQILEQAVWNPIHGAIQSSGSSSASSPLTSAWNRLFGWLNDEEPTVRALALRLLDSCILAAGTIQGRIQRKQLARLLIDIISGDELTVNRMDAAVLLGKLSCVLTLDEGAAWLHDTAYPILKAHMLQTLPFACMRIFQREEFVQTLSSSGSSGSLHKRTPSGSVERPRSSHRTASPGPSSKASNFTSYKPAAEGGEDILTQISSMVCGLEAFGYLLDSSLANIPVESDGIDDMFATLLNQTDMNIFVKAQVIVLLTTQLRHTYRNRRRIVKLLPAVKRLMSGGATNTQLNSSIGATAGNVFGSTQRLHPYLLRVLSQFVATWYCLPPDRLLRRFPTPTILKGYAARQFYKLTAGSGPSSSPFDSSNDSSSKDLRRHPSSSQISSSSLSTSVYSLLDSDQLGWANSKGVDSLLQDLMSWNTKRTLLSMKESADSDDKKATSSTASTALTTKPKHRGRGADSNKLSVTGWNTATNASISLNNNDEDYVNELLSQWNDLSFNLRSDMTVAGSTTTAPLIMIHSPTTGESDSASSNKLVRGNPTLFKANTTPAILSSTPPTAAGLLATKAARGIRSHTLEFDVKTSSRTLTLTNKSSKYSHDFFLQVYPSWLFLVEPGWGTLAPMSSQQITIRFLHSPLDLPGTKVPGYIRVRSAHGFAMERIELLGLSGSSLRILNASGGHMTPEHLTVNPNTMSVNATSSATNTSAASSSSPPISTSSPSIIDFGICFLGVSKVQHLYVQNMTHVSTQATIFYMGPDTQAQGNNQTKPTDKDGSSSNKAFSVIPSLLFLRPHETKRISIIFYPTTIQKVVDSRIGILGLGEESYVYTLRGRGGIPFKIVPGESLDFGLVETWKGTGKELAREMNQREQAEANGMTTANNNSALPQRSSSAVNQPTGIYKEFITIINYNPNKSLPVSFRYNGQKYSMPSDGSDSSTTSTLTAFSPTAANNSTGSFSQLTQLSEFDVLYIKDMVIPPGCTQRIPITLIAQHAGSFSKRVYINTPMTPTDSMSILVTAHIGPLLTVGQTSVINLPPASVNTAVHYVVPIVNLSKMTLNNLEIQGLKRTPIYFGISRMPPQLMKQEKRKMKRASQTAQPDATPLQTPTIDELNDYFDPVNTITSNIPHLGRDFLPSPIAFQDFTTTYLSQFNDMSFTIKPYETLLLHLWFVTHIPGFYCIPFQLRTTAPYWNTYGPIEIKAVCLARSQVPVVPNAAPLGQTEGAASLIHASEDPANIYLLQSALDVIAANGIQYRGDVSSLSYYPLKKFSACPTNKAIVGGFNLPNEANSLITSKSYANEFVAVPSERFDEEVQSYVIPVDEGSSYYSNDQPGANYAMYRLPNALAFSSTVFKLPPRLWLWNRKTLLLMLSNLSNEIQPFHTMLTFPFTSNFCTEIERHAEYSPVDGSLAPLSVSNTGRKNREAPNRLQAFKTTKIDLALLSLEEWAGQKAALEAATERAKNQAALAEQEEAQQQSYSMLSSPSGGRRVGAARRKLSVSGFPSDAPTPRRPSVTDAIVIDDFSFDGDSSSSSSASRVARRYRPHEIATGFLAVIDAQNHLSVCVLRGLLGDLISIETPSKQLVFNCTTPNTNANMAQSDTLIPPANPVTLYLKLHNHTDLNISFGFQFGSGASEVLSATVPTVSSGFSMVKPTPSILTAYETRFIPISFAPSRLGKFQTDFIAFYKNPYQPSERFEFFKTKLIGNYIAESMIEFEGETAMNGPRAIVGGTSINTNTSFLDCGTVIVAPNLQQPINPLIESAAASSTRELPFTLLNTSSQELLVTAVGTPPFYVSSSDSTTAATTITDANVSNPLASPSASEDGFPMSPAGGGGLVTTRRKWAERRAARLRQKSGTSYVFEDGEVGLLSHGSSAFTFNNADESTITPAPSLYPPPVSQLLLALNSIKFRVSFRPTFQHGVGAFSAQLIISFLHYFKLIDCFGWAGQLQLQSNWGVATSSLDVTPTALVSSTNNKPAPSPSASSDHDTISLTLPNQESSDTVSSLLTSPRARFGIGYGGGMRSETPRHHRDQSMATTPTTPKQPIPFFHMPHARHGSISMSNITHVISPAPTPTHTTTTGGNTANAIDLGLSPIKRMLKKPFTLTNTGSMVMYIGRIDIVNVHGATSTAGPVPTFFPPTSNVSLHPRAGGMRWSFAHTTVVRTATQGGSAKEIRQHTISSSAGSGPGLNVHARQPLNATMLKSNSLSNSMHNRRQAQIRNGTFDSVTSNTTQLADGFTVEDLDEYSVDWDEVDYQLEVQQLTSSAAANEAAALAAQEAKRRSGRGAVVTNRRGSMTSSDDASGRLNVDTGGDDLSAASGDINSTGEGEESLEELLKDCPIILHPGHSLPLWLWYYKDQPGTYMHEVQVSCIDPTIATAAATLLTNTINNATTETAVDRRGGGPPTLNRRGSLTSILAAAELKKAQANPSSSSNGPPTAALFRAAAQGDFSGWNSEALRCLIFKSFNFLFKLAAQDILKIDGGYTEMDFGIVKIQAPNGSSSNSLSAPSLHSSSSATSLHGNVYSKSMSFTFMNEGSIPLHWRFMKLNVELSRIKSNSKQSPDPDDDDDFIDEERIHENAFQLSPPAGVLQPKQRQTVVVTFNPSVPHLKYVWNLSLQTQEMSQYKASTRPEQFKSDPTICRLIGIAGSSLLQLISLDDVTGLERPMLSSPSGGSELSFGCISIGCDRHKRFLVRNLGEISSTFEFKNSSQRFHLIPTQGVIPPNGSIEINVSFLPPKAKFYSTTVMIRWGSTIVEDDDDHTREDEPARPPLLSETIRLLITGKGGLSDLHVPDSALDFGTVTINQDHLLLLRVQNVGAAEGEVTIEIEDKSVRLKDPNQAIFVPAGSHFDIPIIFHPTTLLPLDTRLFVRSPTATSFQQEVTLIGLVGVPNLVVEPFGILDYLDFGTCLTNTERTIDFTLINMGNVDIKFEVVFLRLKAPGSASSSTLPPVHAENKVRRKNRKVSTLSVVNGDQSISLAPINYNELDEFPSLTRIRHSHHHHSKHRSNLLSFFGSTPTGGQPSPTNTQNELFYEDFQDQLEEFTPTGLSCYPNSGRISATTVKPLGETTTQMASSMSGNKLKLSLTFSPTQSLEMLECAILIRSTHAVAANAEEERENKNTSAFDSLYAIVRGLAGEQKLLIDTMTREIDFGICRVGETYTKIMTLSNPGNIRVDYHIGPDLENDVTWKNYVNAAGTNPQTPYLSPILAPQPSAISGELAQVGSIDSPAPTSPVSPGPPGRMDYSALRKLWLESFNSLGFDLIYSGEVLPGRSSNVTIVFTPKDESHVSVKVRIISNAKLETIEISGQGAQSQLHLLRTKTIRSGQVQGLDTKIDVIDFGLLPIIGALGASAHLSTTSNLLQSAGSSSLDSPAYRKLYWLYNSGHLPASFLISRNELPPEFEVRPMEATVPPLQFIPLTISFNPRIINHPITFMLKFLGTADFTTGGATNKPGTAPTSSSHAVAIANAKAVALASQLSIKVCGSGGFGILGVCFLNDSDNKMRGLDFDIVSVHSQHMVEKYFSLYNCGSVPLRIKVEVDNPYYSVGIAGTISSLSMQIVDVVTSTPIDEAAIQNEIRYNSKLNKYHVTNTHHMIGVRKGSKLITHEKAIGESAFDYQENEDGTLERTSRASVLTYLVAGTVPTIVPPTQPAEGSNKGGRVNIIDSVSNTGNVIHASDSAKALIKSTLDSDDSYDYSNMFGQSSAAALVGLTTSTATSNPFTAKLAGASMIEEVLMPGKYIPIFVRLLVAEEKSYMGNVTVSSEHSFVNVPVRAEGGVVQLSHTGSLDFGTIGCFHRYTKTIVLRNTGTVPTRAKLFWNIRGNGQDESGGSTFALSGAKPFSNPFIHTSDEESSEEEEEETQVVAKPSNARRSHGSTGDGSSDDEEDEAQRQVKLMKQRAARLKRKQAKEARLKAANEAQGKSLQPVDTYKSILRLYALDDAPPVELNIPRLWWQHCIKFIRILLRTYKMMYPTRVKKLFAYQQQNFGQDEEAKKEEEEKQQAKPAISRPNSRPILNKLHSRDLETPDSKRAESDSDEEDSEDEERKSNQITHDLATLHPEAAATAPPGGLEDYLIEVEQKKKLAEAEKLKLQKEQEEEARLKAQEERIKLAVVKVAEMDPSLREYIGGSPLENSSEETINATKDSSNKLDVAASAASLFDSDIGLPPSHPMYASALKLSQHGKQIETNMKTLVQKVHHRFTEGDNPALTELLAAASRLNLKMAHKKLPRIGDPGDGLVDMKAAESADRISQLRLAPGTILLGKDSRVEVAVDLNIPRPGNFNATLVVECELSGVERYEIPLRALAAQVNFIFDDNSKLDFGRLPLGETELRTRTLTNLGEIPVKFRVENENPGLMISPLEGVIPPGRRKPFAFTFRPIDETVQQLPIKIYTNCTPTLVLQVFGAGGVPKLHMDNFERMDFGRCMIGKSQTRLLRLTNTGNANLPILVANLEESVVFHKGSKAAAARDAAEQLNQKSSLLASPIPTAITSAATTATPAAQTRRRVRRSAVVTDHDRETFGLNQATLANAGAKHPKARRSIFIPAGGHIPTKRLTGKKGTNLLSALGLPTTANGSDTDGEDGVTEENENDLLDDVDDGDVDIDDDSDEDGSVDMADGSGGLLSPVGGGLDGDDLAEHFGRHDWPETRFHIPPGESYELPIQFRPPKEDIFVGRVVIETLSQAYNIELVGTGREALLVYDQKMIEFQDCLVGNTYTKEFSLMNVGEVKYPVKLILQDKIVKPMTTTSNHLLQSANTALVPGSENALAAALQAAASASPSVISRRAVSGIDLKVSPDELILAAFEKKMITVTFTPTRDMKCSAKLILDSIYSHNVISVHMVAGTASLELSTTKIDFGLVEQGHKVSAILNLKNTGTLPLAYRIKPPSIKPFHSLPFNFSKWTGIIGAGLDIDIMCRAHLLEIGSFCEELCIETERIGQRYFFTVQGECAKSYVDPNKFQHVNYGYCLVGEPVSQVIAIQNEGGYPLEFDMKFNYPLTVTPKQGRIGGKQTQTFQVSWIPTGGYDMRSIIHVDTNIGVFDIAVRGVGAYPRFVLRDAYLDFGVGAFHHTYRKSFGIINKGKVAINWSIPNVDLGYTVEPESGLLGAGEECEVVVSFTATRVGIYHGNFIVESKGRYREVNVVGIGGVLSLDYPELVDMGSCACGQWQTTILTIKNTGDVTLNMKFRLDRTSIDAEPNSDDEPEDGPQFEDESRPSMEMLAARSSSQSGVQIEVMEDEQEEKYPENEEEKVSRIDSVGSHRATNLTRQFAVKCFPPHLSILPKTSGSVMVRTFVPMMSVEESQPFQYCLLLKAIEATLPVYFHGRPTTVELSNYAKTLLLADRETVLKITRTPHPFQSRRALPPWEDDRLLLVQPNTPPAALINLTPATSSHILLSPSTFSHTRLSVTLTEYQRQQCILLERVSHRLSTRSLQDQTITLMMSSTNHRAIDTPRQVEFDLDVIACYQCLDSLITSLTMAIEHRPLIESIETEASRIQPFSIKIGSQITKQHISTQKSQSLLTTNESPYSEFNVATSGVASSFSSNLLLHTTGDLVSRTTHASLPSTMFAWSHAPQSQSRVVEAHIHDSGTGRSQPFIEAYQHQPNPLVHETVSATTVTTVDDATDTDSDGVLLPVYGVTHLIDSSLDDLSSPSLIEPDEVLLGVLTCEPHLPIHTHSALLKWIEPTQNVTYLQILPNLLANPPQILD